MSQKPDDDAVNDRRVTRTRDALRRAMVELILERGFEAISISEIAERANVGRSTFYAHYADKEDLLQGSMEFLRRHLQERINQTPLPETDVHPALAFCLPMLEHAEGNRSLFQSIAGRRSGYMVQEIAHDMWADFIRAGWPSGDEIAVQAIAGGFGSTLSWWLAKAPNLNPREVDQRFRALVQPVLAAKT